jgi:uncharacterized protein (TIGR03083 family)
MGMNPDLPASPEPTFDDLAAYALDAVDPDQARSIEAHLAVDRAAAAAERSLRAAAGEFGASGGAAVESGPPPDLRGRVLATARARRRPHHTEDATPVEMHRIELSRVLTLLRRIDPGVWTRPVDPPEFRGRTVHDVAAHLVANESLLAAALGVGVPSVPEVETTNEPRTRRTQARHRDLAPAAAVDELEAAADAVDTHVSSLTADGLDRTIDFWGRSMNIRRALFVRAFETWTHADDVRRAAGLAEVPPPTPTLHAMCRAAVGLVPDMLRARGIDRPGRLVRFHLTGPGADSWDVALDGGGPRVPGPSAPDAELMLDTVAFCRAVSDRLPAGGLSFTSAGDDELAGEIVTAIPALAVL